MDNKNGISLFLMSTAKVVQGKISTAYTWYRRLLMIILRRLLKSPLPIKIGVGLITVFLPFGFFLNGQNNTQLNYLADQMSGFVGLGVGLIFAYSLIDRFNEKAEEAKYGNVRFINFHYLNIELTMFISATVGLLYLNNPDRQEQLDAGSCAGNLMLSYQYDFSDERQTKLEGTIQELDERAEKMLRQSHFTPKEFDQYFSTMEDYIEMISGSYIPRLVETKLDLGIHALLAEADHDLKRTQRALALLARTQMWSDPKGLVKDMLAKMSPAEKKASQLPDVNTIRETGRGMVATELVFVVKILLKLFAHTSLEVERSKLFPVLKEQSKNFRESHPDLIPEDPYT